MSKLIINPNERAVSSDVNRLQTMQRTLLEETMRWQYGAETQEDEAAGLAVVSDSVTAPPGAVVLNGIMGSPDLGASTINVTPGALYLTDVDSPPDADASFYKLIVDAGTAAPLVLAPNTSGFTRIDVLECQRNPDVVTETDTRDIFNAALGLFNATSVPKVAQDQLTYRLRQGVPNNGYPGTVTGWLPLMVCIVPTGFLSNDNCTFYDVRPLGSDLQRRPFDVTDDSLMRTRMNAQALPDVYVNSGHQPTVLKAMGIVETVLYNRRLGGNLNPNAPGYLDCLDATNVQEGGFSFPASSQGLWFLYFAAYFGLPRWARYTPSTAGVRKPSNPRGVAVFSLTTPDSNGFPAAPLNAPTGLGFNGATTSNAKMVLGGIWSSLTSAFAVVGGVLAFDDEFLFPANGVPGANFLWEYPLVAGTQPVTIVVPTDAFKFFLTDSTSHPRNAKSVRLRISITYTFGAAPIYISGLAAVSISDQSNGSAAARPVWTRKFEIGSGGTGNAGNVGNNLAFEVELPLYFNKGTGVAREVDVSIGQEGGAGATISNVVVELIGWGMQE
jgi:hypothetical protein